MRPCRLTIGRTEGIGCVPIRIVSAGTQGRGGGGSVGETRATRWTLRPPRCGDVQPSLAGAAVSGASGGIGSRHSDTRHQTPRVQPCPPNADHVGRTSPGGQAHFVGGALGTRIYQHAAIGPEEYDVAPCSHSVSNTVPMAGFHGIAMNED